MNNNFKIAILQLNAINDPNKSLLKGIEAWKVQIRNGIVMGNYNFKNM